MMSLIRLGRASASTSGTGATRAPRVAAVHAGTVWGRSSGRNASPWSMVAASRSAPEAPARASRARACSVAASAPRPGLGGLLPGRLRRPGLRVPFPGDTDRDGDGILQIVGDLG